MIVYHGEIESGRYHQLQSGLKLHYQQAIQPMCRYLNAEVNSLGKNPGPLRLSMRVDESSARLVLQSRVKSRKHQMIVDNYPWVSGREVYSIRCARRRVKRDGYLCMKFKPGRRNKPTYCTCIVPSIKRHSEEDKFTLFRLLPVSIKQALLPESGFSGSGAEEQSEGRKELEDLSTHYRHYSEWRAASDDQ